MKLSRLTQIGCSADFEKPDVAAFKRAMRKENHWTLMLLNFSHVMGSHRAWAHLVEASCLQALARLLPASVRRAVQSVHSQAYLADVA